MNEIIQKKWEDVYVLPLKALSEGCTKIMTDNFRMAFDFIPKFFDINSLQVSSSDQCKIVRIINGSGEKIMVKKEFTRENTTIYVNGKSMIMVRGWGYLTGIGGLRLGEDEATRLQTEFADYIITQLKNACD